MGGSRVGCREQGRARHTPHPSPASASVVPCDVASGPGRYQTGLVAFTCDWPLCLHWPCGKVTIPASGRLPLGMAPGLPWSLPWPPLSSRQPWTAWRTTQPVLSKHLEVSSGQELVSVSSSRHHGSNSVQGMLISLTLGSQRLTHQIARITKIVPVTMSQGPEWQLASRLQERTKHLSRAGQSGEFDCEFH